MVPACGGSETPPGQNMAWDSSGVRIIESVLDPGSTPLEVGPSVEVLAGMSDGGAEHQFYRVRGVTRLQDGAVAVLNGLPPEIRAFDSGGRLLWKLGRSGSGPGEFSAPASVERLHGDTLVVYDPALQRFTLISPEGRMVRTVSPTSQVFDFGGFVSEDRVASSRGTLQLVVGRIPHGFQEESPRLIEIVNLVSGTRDTVTTARGDELYVAASNREGSGQNIAQFRVPFTVSSQVAVGNARVHVLDPYQGTISSYSERGRLERIVRISGAQRRIEQVHRERVVDELVGRHPDRAAEIRAAHAGMSFPELMPVYDRLLVANDGVLWLRRYDPFEGAEASWVVLDSEGWAIGEVHLSSSIEVLYVRGDTLTGLQLDEVGVEYIVEVIVGGLPI